MQVELSDSEIQVVCVALAYLRDTYNDQAESTKTATLPEGRPLVEMEADYTSSANSLQALIDKLTPLFKP